MSMTQKMDHQLTWIIHNEATYSKEEIKAAHDELKRRSNALSGKGKLKDDFEKYWNSLKSLLGLN